MLRSAALVALILLCCPGNSLAGIGPTFWLSKSSWQATHIVVIDGNGVVVESWKGDSLVGQRLPVEEWHVPKEAVPYYRSTRKAHEPEQLSGERRVLFLVRHDLRWWHIFPDSRHYDFARDGDEWKVVTRDCFWTPAPHWGEMQYSMAWLEAGRAYSYRQLSSPGSTLLYPERYSAEEFKAFVLGQVQRQLRLAQVILEPDAAKRAEAYAAMIQPDKKFDEEEGKLHLAAIDHLLDCGPAALPVVCRFLADDAYNYWYTTIIRRLPSLAGEKTKDVLVQLLRKELQFWKLLSVRRADAQTQLHIYVLYDILNELEKLPLTTEDVEPVRAIMKVWDELSSQPESSLSHDYRHIRKALQNLAAYY